MTIKLVKKQAARKKNRGAARIETSNRALDVAQSWVDEFRARKPSVHVQYARLFKRA